MPRLWEIDDLAADVATARSELQSASFSFDLLAPVEELRDAQATSRAAGRRLGVVGGEAAALLFAFALLAAMTLRPDLLATRRRLAWYGARGWQLALVTVAESAALALAGTAIGLAVGLLGGAVVAERAGAPVADVLVRSVLSGEGLVLAVVVAAAATAVLVGVVAARASRARFGLLDAAAVAAAALVVLEVTRGDGEGDLPLLLPALVTFAVAVLVARLLRPALRLVERLARGRSLGLRIASLSLARNPGYAIAATAFLVVSFGLALFAESYRSTLARGERDQAAHRVPLDYVVREDLRRLIPVQDAAPLARFGSLPGVEATPVLRLTGGVGRLEGETGITLLGIDPGELAHLNGWRDSEARASRQELARPDRGGRGRERPAARPDAAGAHRRRRPGPALRRDRRPDGPLLARRPRRAAAGGGSRRPARGDRDRAEHADPGARRRRGPGAEGIGRRSSSPTSPAGSRTGSASAARRSTARPSATRSRTRSRPGSGPGSRREPLPVLATPRLSAAADDRGLLPLQIAGERLTVRVVGTIGRFPGVDGQAVVGDGEALAAAVDLARPGAGRVNEVWLRLRDRSAAAEVDRALAAKPFNVLSIESRRALEADARRDPIAHGTLLALTVAAIVALGLALAGILLTVLGDLRDDSGELLDLEAQGASPSLLRRIVRLRALTVAAAGLVAGAFAGLALTAVVTDLVGLTARATAPEPPLVLDVDALVVAAAVVAYALVAAALILLATRRAFSAPAPAREVRDGARMSALVRIEDVFRVYPSPEGGVAALQGLSLAVEEGELCVVLGPSGSGKSTLLRIVAGFDRASAGSVRVAGVDVGALGGWGAARFRSRSIGYADQHYWRALAGELTARELVGIQLGLAGVGEERARRARGRAARARRARRPPRRASARALRRRAAARRALRGARGQARTPDRGRADRRARRGDRARRARADRRARARVGRHRPRRQPRSRLG